MKTKIFLSISAVALSGFFIVSSCKKDEEKNVTTAQAMVVAKSDVSSDNAYNDIFTETEYVMSTLESNKYPTSGTKSASLVGGVTISVTKGAGDSTIFPKEITITYSDYASNSGIKKNGTIKITQSARIRKAGAVRTITLENFIINDSVQIQGKKTVTNLGLVDGKPSIKIQLENGKIITPTYFITRNFTRTLTWLEGFAGLSIFNIWDDVYQFTETASGSTKDGFSYSTTTKTPLNGSFRN